MKVLFFTSNLAGGNGWSQYSIDIISSLQIQGIDCVSLVDKKYDQVEIKQLAVLRKPMIYFSLPLLVVIDFLRIFLVIFKEKPDIIHFLVEPYAFFLPLISIFFDIPSVITVHGTYAIAPFKSYFKSALAKIYYKKLKSIISISNFTAQKLITFLPEIKNKIKVVYNGVDLSKVQVVSTDKLIFNKNDRPSFIFIGQISERKGLVEAVEALHQYSLNFNKNFTFHIIGSYVEDSLYVKKIRRLIKNYGLESNIILTGRVDEQVKKHYFNNADLFIMLSKVCDDHFEGFGLVYLEANAQGLPVIGPNTSGAAEAIQDRFSGFKVDIFNAKQIAIKINEALHGAIKSENCISWAKEHDIKLTSAEVSVIYNDLFFK